MSKIFVSENPQAPAPLHAQLAQAPGELRALVDRVRGRNPVRTAARNHRRPQGPLNDPIMFVLGLIMLGALGVAVYLWHKELLIGAAVFVLFGTFARSPIFAVGGAVLLPFLAA